MSVKQDIIEQLNASTMAHRHLTGVYYTNGKGPRICMRFKAWVAPAVDYTSLATRIIENEARRIGLHVKRVI